jgi:two-component system, OmpR family, KDP operon response regulator KdpE
MTANNSETILVVEDEPEIRRFLRLSLTERGYSVIEATKAEEGLKLAAEGNCNLILLDIGLPDLSGMEVIKRVRAWSHMPIVILSARDQEADKIAALEAGADDYVTKPFGVLELIARVKVALRHASNKKTESAESAIVEAGDLVIDISLSTVHKAGVDVHLTPTEYKLLVTLLQTPGKLVTQQHLLREVWGPGYAKEGHYLRTYMGQLRHKLEDEPSQPKHLITEPGVGYRFVP